jgi:cation-transporting ATPase E
MIGDGVNDVLAIKQADFGIAMGSGTGACRAIAQLILLSNNFKILPYVIAEGRRVIANIERTANLFIAKTTYVFALALVVAVAQVPFPFLPRHLTLIGFLTIGMPALFLSLSPNTARAQHGFVSRVLRFSIPAGGISAAMTFIAYAFTRQIEPMNIGLERTTATLTTIGCGLSIFILLARPVTLWFKLLMIILLITFGIVVAVPGPSHFFALVFPPVHIWAIIVILPAICFAALRTVRRTLFMIMTFFLH